MNNERVDFNEIQNYYNSISTNYDRTLATGRDAMIRNHVKDYFIKTVKPGTVMDFGGGTGLDLPWLTDNNNSVIFCEPSAGMRTIAEERIKQLPNKQQVNLLAEKKTNFSSWDENNMPCNKVDAVLADFNVLNNIADINLLFKKLTMLINDSGHFIGTVINYSFFSLLKMSKAIAYKSLFNKEPLQVEIKSGDVSQQVFIYSDNHLRKAYSNYFKLIIDKPIQKTGFRLVHLQKFTE